MKEEKTVESKYEFKVDIMPEEYHSSQCAKLLFLPTTQEDFTDALDRISATDTGFITKLKDSKRKFLWDNLSDTSDFFELNHLAECLNVMTETESLLFEAMCKMEKEPPDISRLINLTHNLNNCVMAPAPNLKELGIFAVEGNFFPEFDSLSDGLLQYLDYESLGHRFKDEQGGVIIDGVFVANLGSSDEFKTPYKSGSCKHSLSINVDFRIVIDCKDDGGDTARLELPATKFDLCQTAIAIGKEDLLSCQFENIRSSIPRLNEFLTGRENIYELNYLAEHLQMIGHNGELPKYKAALEIANCTSLSDYKELAESINSYEFLPEIVTASDYGEWELIGEYKLDRGSPGMEHFDFTSFGIERLAEKGMTSTPYGIIRKNGSELLQVQEDAIGQETSNQRYDEGQTFNLNAPIGNQIIIEQKYRLSGINIDSELIIEEDHVNAYISVWFDVDERLGLNTKNTDEYVNLYADYYPDGWLDVYYIHRGPDAELLGEKPLSDLTAGERERIIQQMRNSGMDELIAEINGVTASGLDMK